MNQKDSLNLSKDQKSIIVGHALKDTNKIHFANSANKFIMMKVILDKMEKDGLVVILVING